MNRISVRCRLALLIAALVLPRSVLAGDGTLTDIVLVIDVSGSMNKLKVGPKPTDVIPFDDLKARLKTFIARGLPLNSSVTVITFGTDARRHVAVQLRHQKDRDELQKVIDGLKPEGWTYMAKGLDLALQDLKRLKKEFPTHQRLLFLITDGVNEPPPTVPGNELITFENLRKHLAGELQLKPGEDYYFWYARLSDAPPSEKGIDVLKPENVEIKNKDWGIGQFSVNHRVLHLGTHLPGDWTAEYPTQADRERGEQLTVVSYNCKDVPVRLGPLAIPNLPKSAQVWVEPATVVLKEDRQNVVLRVRGQGVPPGKYEGRLPVSAPGLIVANPQHFHVDFEVAQPQVSVLPNETLDLGSVTLLQAARGRILLEPNAVARSLRSVVKSSVELEGGLNGLRLEGIPSEIQLTDRQALEATAQLLPTYEGKAGVVTGKITFKPADPYVKVSPGEVPLRLELMAVQVSLDPSRGRVKLDESKKINYNLSVRKDSLPPGSVLRVTFGAPMPQEGAPPLRLETKTAEVTPERPQILLQAEVEADKLVTPQPETWTYRIPVHIDSHLFVLAVHEIRLELQPKVEPLPVPPQVILVHDPDIRISPEGNPQWRVRLDSQALAPGAEVKVKLGPVKVSPGAPGLRLEPAESVISREKSELVLRAKLDGPWPLGEIRYEVPLRSTDPRYYFEPRSLSIVADQTLEGQHPNYLSARTRAWPFWFRFHPSAGQQVSPAEYTVEFQLPDRVVRKGSVEPVEGDRSRVLLRPPHYLEPLAGVSPNDRQVSFTLRCGEQEVRRWTGKVSVVQPYLERLRFFRVEENQDVEPTSEGGSLELAAPARVVVRTEGRYTPELAARRRPKERLLLVQRDRHDGRLTAGEPAPPQTLEMWQLKIEEWRKRGSIDGETGGLRVLTAPDPVLGDKITFLPPEETEEVPERTFWSHRPEKVHDYHVAARFLYDDGTEEWTDVYRIRVTVRGYIPAAWILGGVLVFVLGVGALFAIALGMRIPPLGCWNLSLLAYDRVVFEPNNGSPAAGRCEERPLIFWDRIQCVFRRTATVKLLPSPQYEHDPQRRQALSRRLWFTANGKELCLMASHAVVVNRQPLPAKTWKRLGGYKQDGMPSQRHQAEVTVTFPLARDLSANLAISWTPAAKPRTLLNHFGHLASVLATPMLGLKSTGWFRQILEPFRKTRARQAL